MKRLTFLLIIGVVILDTQSIAQPANQSKKTTTKNKQAGVAQQQKKSAVKTSNTEQLSIKDKIEQRLKDSASEMGNQQVNSNPSPVINGIRVTTPGASAAESATTPSRDTVNATGNVPGRLLNTQVGVSNTQASGNNSVPITSPTTNNPVAGSKPVTGEQSQYNTSDLNRNQMNVINQNQNASTQQNNPVTITSQNASGTQWGQNQVGENLWTPPPTIIASGFGRDFPAIQNATWSMDNNKNYIARYKNGDWWATTAYNAAGIRIETRTEYPVSATYPSPVVMYREKIRTPITFNRISRIERQGKPTLFEVTLSTGRVIYVNETGLEVPFE